MSRNAATRPDVRKAVLLACGSVAGAVGVVVLVGWAVSSAVLTGASAVSAPTQPATAVSFILLGGALLLVASHPRVADALVALTAAVAVVSLGRSWGHFSANPRWWLTGSRIPVDRPGQMAPVVAGVLLALAAGLLLRAHMPTLAPLLGIAVATFGYVSVLGFLYGVGGGKGAKDLTGIAVYAALGFMATGIGLLTLAPPRAALRLIRSNPSVRALSWRLLPVALMAPPTLGVLRLQAQTWGLLNLPLGLGVMTVGWSVSMLLVWWRSALVIERTDRLADRDQLTGLLNRRGFDRGLAEHARQTSRYGPSGCLLMIDLDHLKELNDEHGHGTGDMVLAGLGNLLASRLRESDLLARVGGDEFLVLTPRGDRASGERLADELCRIVRARSFPAREGTTVRATISVGVAAFTAGRTSAETVTTADQALYEAKRRGRDTYVVAPTVSAPDVSAPGVSDAPP
jgi:diguanylate cyclase (GGDEF)-like protein